MVELQAAPMIDILIPVLGRPHNAAPLVQNILNNTVVPVTIVFLISRGDPGQRGATVKEARDRDNVRVIDTQRPAGAGDYARKINEGFRDTDSEWVFSAADDIRFHPGWDTTALKLAGDRYDVVATNDMANSSVKRGQFGTHNLVRRRYVTASGATADNQPGLVLHEGYDHNFPDRELCHLAQSRGRYVFARHAIVKHYHPLWKTAPHDATYKKALRHFHEDHQLFVSRAHLWGYHGLSATERKLAA